MKQDLILANISKHILLNEEEQDYFLSLLSEKGVKKKDYILRHGQYCRYINFVNSGTLRAYYLNDKGKESTIMFAPKDWWVTDMYCFIKEQPAMLNIQAIEESAILQLSKTKLDLLYKEIPKFERFFRILMQNAYIREQLRSIQNLSHTAEERYDKFLHKYPSILPHITQK